MVIMNVFNTQPHEARILCGKSCREQESCGSLSLEFGKLWVPWLEQSVQGLPVPFAPPPDFFQGTSWELWFSSVDLKGNWKRAFLVLLLLMICYFLVSWSTAATVMYYNYLVINQRPICKLVCLMLGKAFTVCFHEYCWPHWFILFFKSFHLCGSPGRVLIAQSFSLWGCKADHGSLYLSTVFNSGSKHS